MRSPNSNSTARKKGFSSNRGFSLIELLIVIAIILIVVAIAIPNLLRSRIAANEASAVENLRTITTASVVYSTTYQNGYPPTLATLGGSTSVPATCNLAILVDSTLTTAPNQKSGFTFAYTGQSGTIPAPAGGCAVPGFNGYLVTAVPISQGVTGQRSFCSNEPATIYFDITGAAIASPVACVALRPL
jgi:type IV pilus assembly protein PilA